MPSAAENRNDDLIIHQNNYFKTIPLNCNKFSQEEFNIAFRDMKSGLKIIQLNARSLRKNFHKLTVLLQTIDVEFDVIAISETWFNSITNLN